jgi:invasion protein IalB
MLPVNLHQGTVILPTGLTLQPGMFVSIDGYWNNVGFHAERIVLIR